MLFNSFQFILVFLPIVLFGYFMVVRLFAAPIYSLAFLAISSLVFYGYWDPRFLPIIVLSISMNYIFGLLIGNARLTLQQRK